jgi:hypothetical protein
MGIISLVLAPVGACRLIFDTLSGESFPAQLIIFANPFLKLFGVEAYKLRVLNGSSNMYRPQYTASITPYIIINHITDHFVVSKIVAEEVML